MIRGLYDAREYGSALEAAQADWKALSARLMELEGNEDRDFIDILIATDCISEGQNLQVRDYCINYDIHWKPVRIIQRFGRIDRIGSRNAVIQLVNFWPDLDLDEYINLMFAASGAREVRAGQSKLDDNEQEDLKTICDEVFGEGNFVAQIVWERA